MYEVNAFWGDMTCSILRRIDISPYIMLHPNRTNLGFDVYDKNKKPKFYLAMTTLANTTFEQAIISSYQTFAKVPLADRKAVDIDLARKSGIKPLGH
jgi:hypothetical protein